MRGAVAGALGAVLLAALAGGAGGCTAGPYLTPAATLQAVADDAPGHAGKAVAFTGRVFETTSRGGAAHFLVAVDGTQLVAYCEYPVADAGVAQGDPVTVLGRVQEAVPDPLPLPGPTPDLAVRVVAVRVAGDAGSHVAGDAALYRSWTEGGVADTVPRR